MNKKIFLICLLASVSFRCTTRYEKDMPADFWFVIKSETEQYDSKTGLYIRKYFTKDSTVKADIRADLGEVYTLFAQYDFLSFPIEFDCKAYLLMPVSTTTIKFFYKGRLRQSTYTSDCLYSKDQRLRADNFDKLGSRLRELVHRQKAIGAMRESNIILL